MLGLVLGLLVIAPSARPFAEERLLLDRRLETLRRILPDGASPAVDGKHVNDLAEEAQLGQIQVRGCVSSESGALRSRAPASCAPWAATTRSSASSGGRRCPTG